MGAADAVPVALGLLQGAIKLGGFKSYMLAATVAAAVAKAILPAAARFGAVQGMNKAIGVMAGPIGWAITTIWTAFDLASPAYRVTVPCVIQLAYMRQKALLEQCPNCNAIVVGDAKFCNECGHKLAQ
jgi:uncharacterized protein YaaW (UPF0174 family)